MSEVRRKCGKMRGTVKARCHFAESGGRRKRNIIVQLVTTINSSLFHRVIAVFILVTVLRLGDRNRRNFVFL